MSDCFFHGKEALPINTFIVCGECGHVWTRDALVEADYEGQQDAFSLADTLDPLDGLGSSPVAVRRAPEDICFCPECIHDF